MSHQFFRLSEYLSNYADQLSNILGTLGHPIRFSLLAQLIPKPLDFSELCKEVDDLPSTVANHLNFLISKGLINRVRRGRYEITVDGQELMEHLFSFHQQYRRRQLEKLQSGYTYPNIEEINMKSNRVQIKPTYQACWLSFTGAIAGVLQSLGESYDVVDVAGYSGYAFLVNMTHQSIHPAAPTAFSFWEEVHNGVEALGYPLHGYYDDGSIYGKQELSQKDLKRLKELKLYVSKQIDQNRPVILWGLHVAEFGIVTGYDEEHYEVSTLRQYLNMEDTPIHYTHLDSPGCLWAYHLEAKQGDPTEQEHLETIQRAITMARGNTGETHAGTPENGSWSDEDISYQSGPQAYEIWAALLEKEEINQFGNAYNAACWAEARSHALKFLSRLHQSYKDRSFADTLFETIKIYQQIELQLSQFQQLFPFPGGNKKPDAISQGSDLLRATIPLEKQAIQLLETVKNQWEAELQ